MFSLLIILMNTTISLSKFIFLSKVPFEFVDLPDALHDADDVPKIFSRALKERAAKQSKSGGNEADEEDASPAEDAPAISILTDYSSMADFNRIGEREDVIQDVVADSDTGFLLHRKRLIEHFTYCLKNNTITWPSRTGRMD